MERLAEFLHALLAGNCLARTFAGAGIRLGSLAADGQAAAVPGTPVAADVAKAGNIALHRSTKTALNDVIAIEDRCDAGNVVVG